MTPSSIHQQQFWLINQLHPESSAYNIPFVFRIKGNLDLDSLEKGLNAIIQRHEILRTTFYQENGDLQQRVAQGLKISIPVVEMDEADGNKNTAAMNDIIDREINHPFDLQKGPLLRVKIMKFAPQNFVLIINFHHIIIDLETRDLLTEELSILYRCIKNDKAPDLEPQMLQYKDFSSWQRQWLSSEQADAQRLYWKSKLDNLSDFLNFPADKPRPSMQSLNGASIPFELSESFTRQLEAFSSKRHTSLFLTLLTAYFTILYRYSQQSEIIVGVPLTNRRNSAHKKIFGCLMNIMPLAVNFSDMLKFDDLLKVVRTEMLQSHRNQELPFQSIIENIDIRRDPSHNPLFQMGFTFEHPMILELEGLETEFLPVYCDGSQLDLFLVLYESSEGVKGHIEYSTALFDHETIEIFKESFTTLLQSIMENPDLEIARLPMMTETRRCKIVHEWNATHKAYDQRVTLHALFEVQAGKTPDREALRYRDRSLSYSELNAKANQLAHHLIKRGVGPDVPVGLFMERSIEMVIGIYGIIKAGGAYVPLDPDYPADRLSYMIEDTGVPVILSQENLIEKLPSSEAAHILLDVDWATIEPESPSNPAVDMSSENLAYLIYTSGSTGKPKGVMNEHKGICNRILWMQDEYGMTQDDTVLQKTPFSFDVSVWEFFWPLLVGSRLAIAPPQSHRDPGELVGLIKAHQVTTIHFVPSMLQIFLEYPGAGTCHDLKRVICSGEALPFDLKEKFFTIFDTELHNLYGPTEAAVDVTYWQCRKESKIPMVPIGRPVANTAIYVLDKFMQPVPEGVPGELFIGGVQVARGYRNRPELTQKVFIADPFSDDSKARLYKTGDLARFMRDGKVEYLGRVDHQVKIRGFRIELGEIESLLCDHPGVQHAAVVVQDLGSADKRLLAYLVPEHREAFTVRKYAHFDNQKSVEGWNPCELKNGMAVSHLNQDETDLMYREIFEDDIYLKHSNELASNACVFDVGANIGLFALSVANKIKNGTVYAFEPVPQIARVLEKNAALYEFNINPHSFGLSDEKSTQTFRTPRVGSADDWSQEPIPAQQNADQLNAKRNSGTYDCEFQPLSQVILENNIAKIDLLKINVKNRELAILAGIDESDWGKIDQIVLKIHDGADTLEEISTILEGRGYGIVCEEDKGSNTSDPSVIYASRLGADHSVPQDKSVVDKMDDLHTIWHSPVAFEADVKLFLQKKLPDYMIPSDFFIIDDMPLTGNGKVNRQLLTQLSLKKKVSKKEHVPPTGELEAEIAGVWADLVKIDRVSITDNFFTIGGNSLLAARFIAQMQVKRNQEISVVKLFQYPTVKSFVNYLKTGDIQKPDLGKARDRSQKRKMAFKKRKRK